MPTSNLNNEQESFDVFLCHNSADKPEVINIANELSRQGVKVWLDKSDIVAGQDWQDAIDQQISTVDTAIIFIGKSGIGPWQDMEIKAFLNQYVTRKCCVVPVFLPSFQGQEFPILLENLDIVDFRQVDPNPIQALLRGIKKKKATINVAALPDSSISRIYFPLSEPPSEEQRAQLSILRRKVNEIWVDGVLKKSLHNELLLSLGKKIQDDAVENAFNSIVELPKNQNQLENNTSIDTVFDATSLLMILGEPGSGKTTTLLQLVQCLIKRAKANTKERIPVVLNLSSWQKGQLLTDWMVDNLKRMYGVPPKLGRSWLDKGYLIPMLDGLDEVRNKQQAACVAAINAYIEKYAPPGLLVCCRLTEYMWLPERLNLSGAIRIEALDQEQIDRFFTSIGSEFEPLRLALSTDPALRELAESPLMLSIMSMAYQSVDIETIVEEEQSLEVRRKQIFAAYVEKMFERKDTLAKVFTKEKVIAWLNWLAKKMKAHSQSVFFVEKLQPSWFDSWKQRNAYQAIPSVFFGIVFGLTDVILGLIVGVITFISVKLFSNITPVERLGWSWKQFYTPLIELYIGIFKLYIFVWLVIIADALYAGLSAGQLGNQISFYSVFDIISGYIFDWFKYYMYTMLFITTTQLDKGIVHKIRESEGKYYPNQGIISSLKNGIFVGSFLLIVLGLILPLIDSYTNVNYFKNYNYILLCGIPGLSNGLFAVIKHYNLRFILWFCRKTPFKFIPFLDYCAKLILLKKVGGGYIFTHRMLLEYFAGLDTDEKQANRKT